MAIIVGTIWWQIPLGNENNSIYDRLAVIHKASIYVVLRNMDPTPIFEDRRFHYRERALNAYSMLAYWLATWIPQIPVQIFFGALFSCIVYPMVNLRAGLGYFLIFFCFSVVSDVAAYFTFSVVVALCPTLPSALHYLPLLQLVLVTANGFREYLPEMPVFVKYLTFGLFTRYMFQGQVLNELQENYDLPYYHEYIVTLGFTGISVGGCFALLLLCTVVAMAAFYLVLKHVDFERR
jgi:hypothetical protein